MAITLISNFSYNGKNPNFERDSVEKISDLRAVVPTKQKYDYGHIVFCKEDGKHYRFMHNYDAPDEANYNNKTGWFQEFAAEGTGGGSIDTSNLATKDELNAKQDAISDLGTIRSGAAKGATSVQEIQLNNDPVAQPTDGRVTISESDPIFKASPAAGIKSSDIAAWNNKGTVTGVKINGTAGAIDANGVVDLGYIDSGSGDTIINGVTDVTVGGASVVSNNKAAIPNASTSAYGVTKLTDAIDKDDSSLAATAKAVSIINANKQDKISDLETIRTDSQNAFKGTINGANEGNLWLATKVNGKEPNGEGEVTIDVGDKNVQSDWNATSGDAFIKNKPTIPTTLSQLTQSASYRTVTDTEKNTWNAKLDKNTADNSYLGKNEKVTSATNADNATNDGNGYNISNTYATKAALSEGLASKQGVIDDLANIREKADNAFTGSINGSKNGGFFTVEKIVMNGNDYPREGSFTHIDLGTVITEHQDLSDYLTTAAAANTYLKKTANAASATKATQDGSGNNIADTYATKSELNDKVDKVTGKQLSTNDFTDADKSKLAGIEDNANNYEHPKEGPNASITIASINPTKLIDENIDKITIPSITVNRYGHVTSASSKEIEINLPDFSKFAKSIDCGDLTAGVIDGKVDISDFFANTQTKLVSGTNIKTINGESILGGGNIITNAYPLVNHGTSDTTFTLTPNVFHVWSNVASLSLTLGSGTEGVANEYLFQFSCLSGQATTLGLPSGIQWANGEVPTLEVLKTYQVSILNNCATIQSFG